MFNYLNFKIIIQHHCDYESIHINSGGDKVTAPDDERCAARNMLSLQ
jgi:hypothetical protein